MELPEWAGVAILLSMVFLVPTGYILDWRSKRTAMRRSGSLTVAVFSGLAGLVCTWVAVGMLFDWPGATISERVGTSVVPFSFAAGTFYITARFVSRALKADSEKSERSKS